MAGCAKGECYWLSPISQPHTVRGKRLEMSSRQRIVAGLLVACLGMVLLPRSSAQQSKARVIPTAGPAVGVQSIAFSPDGAALASGDSDGVIRLLDGKTGREFRRFHHAGFVSSVAFSPDGKTLAAGGWTAKDNTSAYLRLVDVATGREVRRFESKDYNDPITSVAFSRDGTTLASGSYGWMVMAWDVASGKRIARFQGTSPILSVAFSPVARTVAYGSTAGNFDLFDLATGRRTTALNERTTAYADVRHTDGINSVAFCPDGRILATASRDREIKLWDVATGKVVAVCRGHTDAVNSLAFGPDGRVLASGGDDRSIRLWDVATGKRTVPLMGHTDKVLSVAFSPDGQTLASGSSDGTIKLWQLPSPRKTDR